MTGEMQTQRIDQLMELFQRFVSFVLDGPESTGEKARRISRIMKDLDAAIWHEMTR